MAYMKSFSFKNKAWFANVHVKLKWHMNEQVVNDHPEGRVRGPPFNLQGGEGGGAGVFLKKYFVIKFYKINNCLKYM